MFWSKRFVNRSLAFGWQQGGLWAILAALANFTQYGAVFSQYPQHLGVTGLDGTTYGPKLTRVI
jgi:hypothetical protein